MAISNGKFTISDTNTETTSTLFGQIGGLVGVGTRSDGKRYLSDICVGSGINKWAKYKPIRSITSVNLSESERARQFYGFDIMEIFCNNGEETLNTAVGNGGDYPYLKPRGSSVSPVEWFRLRDFDGYNANAEIPYKYTVQSDPSSSSQWVDVYLNPNGEIFLSEITPTEISQNIRNYKVALIYRLRGTSLYNGVISSSTIADVEAGAQPIIRYALTQAGTYDMVLAITNATYWDQEDTDWLYLPEAVFTATYDPNTASFCVGYTEDNALTGLSESGSTVISTSVVVRGIHIDMNINSATEALEGNFILEFGSYKNSEFSLSIEYEEAFSVSKGGSAYFYENLTNIGFDEPYINQIYVRGRVEYRKQGTYGSYETRYIDFVTSTSEDLSLSASEYSPVSLKAILDSWNW